MSWQEELRDGNIGGHSVELAIAGSIGATRATIISSLDDGDVPAMVGRVLRRSDLSRLSDVVRDPNSVAVSRHVPMRGAERGPLTIGLFTNAVVKFLIAAFVLFLVVRGTNAIRNEQAAAWAA